MDAAPGAVLSRFAAMDRPKPTEPEDALRTEPDAVPLPEPEPAPEPAGEVDAPVPIARGRSMEGNTALLFAGTLASRVLGMARETMIASTFDVASTDAFFIAFRIPNALRSLLAEGALRYVFNPVLDGARRAGGSDPVEGRRQMAATLAKLRGLSLVVLTLVTIAGIALARPILTLVSHGFGGDAARLDLGVRLLRVLFPYVFFISWFALGNSALQLLNDYRPGAFAPVALNIAFLLVPFGLMPVFDRLAIPEIYSLAVATLVGGVLQVAWIRPALRRQGMQRRPTVAFDATAREVGGLFVPQLIGQGVYQLNVIVSGRFLGSLPRGAASFFAYGQRIADIPSGLVTAALATAAGTEMQRFATDGDLVGLARTYERAMRLAAVVALPMCVLIAVYGEALVPLIFGYGRFNRLGEGAALEVVASLRWQAMSVAFMAFANQTAAVFGARKKRKQIVWIAALDMAVFYLVGTVATPRLGHVGVAIALASGSLVQLGFLLAAVRRELPDVRFGAIGDTLARALAATGTTALAARAIVWYLPVAGSGIAAKAVAVACGAALVGLYVTLAWVFGCEEIKTVGEKVRRRLPRR